MIETLFEERDTELIKKLTKLLEVTETREMKLSNITEKIYKQLNDLAQSLDVMIGPSDKSTGILFNFTFLYICCLTLLIRSTLILEVYTFKNIYIYIYIYLLTY